MYTETKKAVLVTLIVAVLIAVLVLVSNVPAQTTSTDCVQLYINGALEYESAACVEPTNTPTPTMTATATLTPTATFTPTPTPDPCVHDPNKWHPDVDAKGCEYGHEHKHDPNTVNAIFGAPGAWHGGSEISYAWETPGENANKHEAYSWIVRTDIPQYQAVWIKDFRLQVHATSAPFTADDGSLTGGYLGATHSFSLEANVCDDTTCGVVRTGGWLDYGCLRIDGTYYPLDGQTLNDCAGDAQRIHYYYPDPDNRRDGFKAEFFWYGHQDARSGPLAPVLIAVATGDASVNVNPNNLFSLNFFCDNVSPFDCGKNDSTVQAHVVQFQPKQTYLASDDYYTDRYGALVSGCTAPSLDCVPLVVESPLSNLAIQYRDDTHHDPLLPSSGLQDFDTSGTIEYPN